MKRAVPSEVISRIKELDLSSDRVLAQTRDLFMFSFYTRGMSFIDMAYLRKRESITRIYPASLDTFLTEDANIRVIHYV